MGLEDGYQPPAGGEPAAQAGKERADLGGMVGVVLE
jgi:hypothetical protein